MKYFLKNLGQV